jgi:endonuclease G
MRLPVQGHRAANRQTLPNGRLREALSHVINGFCKLISRIAGCRLLFLCASLLPVLVSAETVRFAHCLGGCPVGAGSNNLVIARAIYTLSFNPDRRIADWVAYEVTAGSIGVATNLPRGPQPDPFVSDTLNPANFASAQDGALELNYFAPLVSFAGTPYWTETNYLTNRVPRSGELNRGSWYGLEWAERNLANRTASLYVVTGPIYGDLGDDAMGSVASESGGQPSGSEGIPTGFFKVVADANGGMAAFLFPQTLPFHIHHCEQLTSVSELERLSGLDLFPELPSVPSTDLSGGLGCVR